MTQKIVTQQEDVSAEVLAQEDELLDIVDEHDQVIGVLPRSVAYQQNKLACLRAVWLLIKNEEGKFWIPRRCAKKISSPSSLDGSTVGHVSSGETYEQAMLREVREELNLDISGMPYRVIGKLTPQTGSISFIEVFELQVSNNFVIDYNKEDFSEFYWLSSQEIIQKYNDGEKIRKTLVAIMKIFYSEKIL
ncbi:NUDIX domain-containing protein [Candidatus Babeliales bacterium]|nr:NUDIX domain-containing protein [Candidatus Babeliales bacterium]MBP9844001.1 NUDIX domain-containing protein [Candidatus Babeliales bacterium]